MRRSVLTAALFIVVSFQAIAQRQSNVWYFGSHVGISFNGPAPVALLNGALDQDEGCASICDPSTGDLLFYTDGVKVWNRTHQLMPNGFGLGGDRSSTQSALILPAPGIPGKYYIFTVGALQSASSSNMGLNYSTVNAQSGGGDVIDKNILITRGATEHLAGARHCDGKSYWVISHVWESSKFIAYLLSTSGLATTPVTSDIGPRFGYEPSASPQYQSDNSIGYLKVSPNGRRLAVPQSASGTVLLFDFDPATGIVSNPITITISNKPPKVGHVYGVTFSPDNSHLYTTEPGDGTILQYDIRNSSPAAIEASRYVVATAYQPGALQIGPDGRIYVANNLGSVSVIRKPNLDGALCDYAEQEFNLKAGCRWGLPNFVDADVLNLPTGCTRPAAAISADRVSICAGQCITYTDQSQGSPTSWQWKFEGGTPGTYTSRNPPQVCYATPGTYRTTLIIFDGSATDSTSINVTVNPPPSPDITGDTTICIGGSVRLHAGGGVSYQWNATPELSCLTCPDPIASPQSTATYTVIVTNASGCRATDSVTVTVVPGATAEAGASKSICAGEKVRLDGSGGGTYKWEPAEGLSCTDCATPFASPAVTTTYRLRVTLGTSCTDVDSVTVTVQPRPQATVSDNVILCAGEGAMLTASGGTTYRWEPTTGLNCSDCPDPIVRPSATTTYRVVVGNANGCTDTAQVLVTVHPLPQVDLGKDRTLCLGESTTLMASGGTSYSWDPNPSLSCTDCPNPTATPIKTSTYAVTVLGENGCTARDSITITLAPSATVSAAGQGTICRGESAQLRAEGAGTFMWSPAAGLSCTDCDAPTAHPDVTTTYTVTLTNSYGCTATDSVTITVAPSTAVSAYGQATICPGGMAQLRAEGAGTFMWSPAAGLSCTDCDAPTAHPDITTTYTVTLTNSYGCTATDTVTVTVLDAAVPVRAHINRDYRYFTGTPGWAPVMLDDPLDAFGISSLTATIHYDNTMLRFQSAAVANLTGGWSITTTEPQPGTIVAQLIAPPGQTLQGTGSLLQLEFLAYLGPVAASELPFELAFSEWPCLTGETTPGRIALDSICGLTYRLVTSYGKQYALDKATPNPFNPTADIQFSLGLDGQTQLVVFNASGEKVAVLIDDYLQPGTYQATWDATEYPAGLYYYRLTSGAWSATGVMVLKK